MNANIVGTITLVLIIALLAGCAGMAWKDASATDTIASYEQFLREYPQSEFAPRAREKLETLYFDEAKGKGTIQAFEAFLRRYPKGRFSPEARKNLGILRCDKAWKEAIAKNTIASYEQVLRECPQSEFAPGARERLEALYFDKAEGEGTILAFETFLRRYPQSRFSAKAGQNLEALYFDKAKMTGTIQTFEGFLNKYPNGNFSAEARRKLDGLRQEIRQMEEAARKVLPQGAKVEVTTVSRYPQKPEFVIAAHLLEGHSADETSPYVRGDYGTHEKLTRLVQFRCARILKSVATDALPSNDSDVVISARHGVRRSYIGQPFSGTDVAMTIYEITLPVADMKKNNISNKNEESIMELWKVRKNIIPSLSFQTQWGGFR